MKLNDLTKAFTQGTYAGVNFSAKTLETLRQFGIENEIPNRLQTRKLHTTLLYSRKYLPNYQPAGAIDPPLVATFKAWDVFLTRPTTDGAESKRALVMKLDCFPLWQRHIDLMNEHQATYDYLEYVPHISLSYDIDDFDYFALPKFEGEIEIVNEYMNTLDLDWAEKNG
jgi:hypothetical protein